MKPRNRTTPARLATSTFVFVAVAALMGPFPGAATPVKVTSNADEVVECFGLGRERIDRVWSFNAKNFDVPLTDGNGIGAKALLDEYLEAAYFEADGTGVGKVYYILTGYTEDSAIHCAAEQVPPCLEDYGVDVKLWVDETLEETLHGNPVNIQPPPTPTVPDPCA